MNSPVSKSNPPKSSVTASPARASGAGHLALEALRRFGTVFALIILIVYFSLATDGKFFTHSNFSAILNQIAVLGVLSLGLTVCLVLGEFDISIGWTASLAGMVCTGLMSENDASVVIAIAAGLGVGVVVGLVNGLVVTLLRVNALLATLASGSVIAGVINWYSIAPFSSEIPESFLDLGQSETLGVPTPALFLAGIAIVLWVFLQQTAAGRRMYALGGNAEAARIAGVRTVRVRIAAFVICAVCASIAGMLLAAQLGSGQPNGAVGLLLSAFAGAFLGSSTWREGEFHVGGTIVGVLIIGVIFSGLALTDAQPYVKEIITGAILVAAVGSASLLRRQAA